MNTEQLSKELLDSELNEFNHNPSGYVASLGWSKDLQKRAVPLSETLAATTQDYQNLKSIIDSIVHTNHEATTIDVVESNSVSDFLCNCIAGKINTALNL